MVEMNPMLMPDREAIKHGNYPPDWVHSTFTELRFKEFYKFFKDGFNSCGKDDRPDPPNPPDVPQVAPTNAVGSFQDYAAVAVKLKQAYTDVKNSLTELRAQWVPDSAKWSDSGLKAINAVIDKDVVAVAPIAPVGGIKIDDHHWTWITAACNSASTELDKVAKGQSSVASGIDDQTKRIKELEAQVKKLEAASRDPATIPPNVDTSNWPTTPGSTDQTIPPAVDNSAFPTGLDSLDDPTSPSTTPTDLDTSGTDIPGSTSQTPSPLDPSGTTTPGITTPSTPSVPSPAATSPMGTGMDIGSLLAQQMMMRNLADQDLNNRRRDLDPRRYDDELDQVAPPQVAAPVTAQPAAVQPATATPAATTQHTGAPTNTVSSTQPAVAPGRTPEADGSVIYSFPPTGKTQKVSAQTAQVLDAAFGNHSGTDAQKAYEKTSAKFSDKKQIGQRVGDFQLKTGDVAMWTNSTAVLVVFGPDEEGGPSLEAIVKGELKPFDTKMPEIASETNLFEGYAHPNGVDMTAPADGGSPSGMPGSADQSAVAGMPVSAVTAG